MKNETKNESDSKSGKNIVVGNRYKYTFSSHDEVRKVP